MNELIKRIITSVILIIILIFSFYNNAILILSLLLIFFQIYYEFLLIFRKIFHNRNKFILYSILFCILICLSILIFKIWLIIDSENTQKKYFYYLLSLFRFVLILEVIHLVKYLKEKKFQDQSK